MDNRLLLKQEFNFPKTTRVVGYLFLAFALVFIMNMPIFGLILALVFSYVCFSKTNNKIDLEAGTMNHKDLPRKNFSIKKYILEANSLACSFLGKASKIMSAISTNKPV